MQKETDTIADGTNNPNGNGVPQLIQQIVVSNKMNSFHGNPPINRNKVGC
jgi:hypothetical protein